MNKMLLAAAAATAMISTAAWATADVYLTGGSASGFIGKGDVQTAFGLKNSEMQKVHTAVKFFVDMEVDGGTYDCTWITGPTHNRKTHTNNKKMKGELLASLAVTDKKTGQYTGWHVNGATITEDGGLVKEGDPCQGDGAGGTVTDVYPGTGAVVEGGLFAEINLNRRQIDPANIVVN